MPNTSFNPSELDPETESSAASRVAKILAGQQQHTEPKPPTEIYHAPVAHVNPPAPAPPASETGEKRTRMTVGKLLQSYKDREADTGSAIVQLEQVIAAYQAQLEAARSKRAFLQDLIAEIGND